MDLQPEMNITGSGAVAGNVTGNEAGNGTENGAGNGWIHRPRR